MQQQVPLNSLRHGHLSGHPVQCALDIEHSFCKTACVLDQNPRPVRGLHAAPGLFPTSRREGYQVFKDVESQLIASSYLVIKKESKRMCRIVKKWRRRGNRVAKESCMRSA
jgi:hypothetical protein